MKQSAKQKTQLLLINVFLSFVCLLALIPILYSFLLSVSSGSGALITGLSSIIQGFTLENYRKILVEEPFLKWLSNSVLLSLGTMIIAMGTSVSASYSFSRFQFAGKKSAMQLL